MSIKTQFERLLKTPSRLREVTQAYVISLIQDSGRRTLQAASTLSGLNPSQFSRFLSHHKELAVENLNRVARRMVRFALVKNRSLINGVPWRVALIVDATLHERSSRHLDNAQRFNHGQGWVIGHQWTNLVLVINDETIPLPPIPFLTMETCKKLKQPYLTEAERIIEFLFGWDWQSLLPGESILPVRKRIYRPEPSRERIS